MSIDPFQRVTKLSIPDVFPPEDKPKKRKKISRTEEKAIYEKYKHKCAICGKRTAFDYGEIDHIKPLAKGGSNRPSNLQWLCHRCNKLKGSKRTNKQVKEIINTKNSKTKKKSPSKKKLKRKIKKQKSPYDLPEIKLPKLKF